VVTDAFEAAVEEPTMDLGVRKTTGQRLVDGEAAVLPGSEREQSLVVHA
jgi:hypothetical protein